MEWTHLIVIVIVWLMLAAVRSIRIESSDISHFELKRRSKAGAAEALRIIEREGRLPDLRALRYVTETILFVLFTALAIIFYDFLTGLILALGGLVLLPAISNLSFVSRRAQNWFDSNEDILTKYAVKWHPFLKWLESRGVMPAQRIHSKEEFLHLAQKADGVFSKEELSFMQEGMAFQSKIVTEVMTPLSVIEYAEESEVVGPVVLDRLHKTGHSRFPVIEGDINHVVGMLYMHSLVPLDKKQRTIRQTMSTEVFYIRSDQTLEHALHAFLRTHHHLFIVVNEYRETVGLLSLEDVIEALLGRKIVDEFDAFDDLRAVASTNPRNNNRPKKHEDV